MRGFFLFLALAFPVVLINPIFWSLLEMEFSAAPVTYHEADGTVTQALLGPKAPWPDWAEVPDGAQLHVRARFEATPTKPSTGFGDLAFKGSGRKLFADYVEKLKRSGWVIQTTVFESVFPSLPPQKLVQCQLMARRTDGKSTTLQASVELEPRSGQGSIHWWSAPPEAVWALANGRAC